MIYIQLTFFNIKISYFSMQPIRILMLFCQLAYLLIRLIQLNHLIELIRFIQLIHLIGLIELNHLIELIGLIHSIELIQLIRLTNHIRYRHRERNIICSAL